MMTRRENHKQLAEEKKLSFALSLTISQKIWNNSHHAGASFSSLIYDSAAIAAFIALLWVRLESTFSILAICYPVYYQPPYSWWKTT